MQCIQVPTSPLIVTNQRQNDQLTPSSNFKPDTEWSIANHVNCQNNSAVFIRNYCKRYNKGPLVIQNLCMNIERGAIYGLIGSSGCGKSTILSSIVGLTKWDSGELLVFGKKPGSKDSGIPGKRLGYMPQDISLYKELSIQEMIQFYGRIYNMASSEIKERLFMLNKLMDLPDNCKLIGNLSGGQKRRVSLALALVHSPELLILDEPTVGLDSLLRIKIWDHLYKMVRIFGTTIIITTHYIEEARYANTIGIIRRGRLLIQDTPSRLLQIYQCDLLEDVVLQLCRNDETTLSSVATKICKDAQDANTTRDSFSRRCKENTILSSIIATHETQEVINGNTYRRTVGFDGEMCSDLCYSKANGHNDNGYFAQVYNSIQRVYGLTCIILTVCTRYPVFSILLLLLPSFKAALSILVLGTVPQGMQFGIVNHEMRNWSLECGLEWTGDICDFSLLSCKFLKQLATGNVVMLEPYDTEEDALAQVQYGKIIGYLTIPDNYSQHALNFAAAKRFAINEDIEGSRIHVHMDNSQYLAAIFTMKHMITSYMEYIHNMSLSCSLGKKETEMLPLLFRQPVYGNNDDKFVDYMLPGSILGALICVSSGVSALMFIADRKLGTLSRALVAGVVPSDVIISHLVAQEIITFLQMLILQGFLEFVFGFPILGPLWLCLVICLLVGLCGALLGIIMGIICNDEVDAIVVEIFVLPFALVFGGVIWPTENMQKVWKSIGYILPNSLATVSLRSVISRGQGLTHPLVWPGVLVLLVWIVVLTICSFVLYRIFCK